MPVSNVNLGVSSDNTQYWIGTDPESKKDLLVKGNVIDQSTDFSQKQPIENPNEIKSLESCPDRGLKPNGAKTYAKEFN
jgi:hypothetical protein